MSWLGVHYCRSFLTSQAPRCLDTFSQRMEWAYIISARGKGAKKIFRNYRVRALLYLERRPSYKLEERKLWGKGIRIIISFMINENWCSFLYINVYSTYIMVSFISFDITIYWGRSPIIYFLLWLCVGVEIECIWSRLLECNVRILLWTQDLSPICEEERCHFSSS